ncbi:Gag-Pol polyprotein [Wickerhamomyces ciferrii]|uniref:Gag-Pol polyprotein n=1 Tax=Wickerhamomyces ciferrii (strain ATCC 14091 / BCRC 22168 / CBS 111 / JCM 3599 / NBRC 0793 / NRRL Y-1031 F-60-10) TaxID=1206466 RepID=K0KSJ0_WICCF|nr:Gag-Pol polyprotein [Wickerhamomyces ciferrii]CCH44278.1 Gag-Pol polyprotein [Wickerhamomyces ciferrii]
MISKKLVTIDFILNDQVTVELQCSHLQFAHPRYKIIVGLPDLSHYHYHITPQRTCFAGITVQDALHRVKKKNLQNIYHFGGEEDAFDLDFPTLYEIGIEDIQDGFNLTAAPHEIISIEEELFHKYPEVFNPSAHGQRNTGLTYNVQLMDGAKRIKQKSYPLNPSDEAVVLEFLEKAVKEGVLEEISSDNDLPVVPMFVTRNRNGKSRIVFDFRALNHYISSNYDFPVPQARDLLNAAANHQFHTTLDIKAAYTHINLTGDGIGVVSKFGTFKIAKMLFGLRSSPGVFNRCLHRVLSNVLKKYQNDEKVTINIYFDDISISSSGSEKFHKKVVDEVLEVFQQHHISLNKEKIQYCTTQLKYLGFCVENKVIKPDLDRFKVVQNWKPPTTASEAKHVSGFFNYFHSYLGIDVSKLLKPFYTFKPEEAALRDRNFTILQDALINRCSVFMYDAQKPVTIMVDSSLVGGGGVLLQANALGQLVPIRFCSFSYTPTQCRYPIIDLEFLSLITVVDKFSAYLNDKVTVYSDNSTVCSLVNSSNLNNRLLRFIERFSCYNINLKKIAGNNNIADILSRYQVENSGEKAIDEAVLSGASDVRLPGVKATLDVLDILQLDEFVDDPIENQLFEIDSREFAVENDMLNHFWTPILDHEENLENFYHFTDSTEKQTEKPSNGDHDVQNINEVANSSVTETATKLIEKGLDATVKDDQIYIFTNKEWKKFIADSELLSLFDRLHAATHASVIVLLHLLHDKGLYNPDSRLLAINSVRKCSRCSMFAYYPVNDTPLNIIPLAKPLNRWHLDYIGPFKSDNQPQMVKMEYILTAIDHTTGFNLCLCCPAPTATHVMLMVYTIISIFGPPSVILSDNASCFHSFKSTNDAFLKKFGIDYHFSSSLHPRSNGKNERFNRSFKSLLKQLGDLDSYWHLNTDLAAFLNNCKPNMYGYSPLYLATGRKLDDLSTVAAKLATEIPQSQFSVNRDPSLQLNHLGFKLKDLGSEPENDDERELMDAISYRVAKLEEVRLDTDKLQDLKYKARKASILNDHKTLSQYAIGEYVFKRRQKKTKNEWGFDGPYIVKRVLENAYVLENLDGKELKFTYNFKDLRPCFQYFNDPVRTILDWTSTYSEIQRDYVNRELQRITEE